VELAVSWKTVSRWEVFGIGNVGKADKEKVFQQNQYVITGMREEGGMTLVPLLLVPAQVDHDNGGGYAAGNKLDHFPDVFLPSL
jgi:hypothetical protein